jgi:hypothetical protein
MTCLTCLQLTWCDVTCCNMLRCVKCRHLCCFCIGCTFRCAAAAKSSCSWLGAVWQTLQRSQVVESAVQFSKRLQCLRGVHLHRCGSNSSHRRKSARYNAACTHVGCAALAEGLDVNVLPPLAEQHNKHMALPQHDAAAAAAAAAGNCSLPISVLS